MTWKNVKTVRQWLLRVNNFIWVRIHDKSINYTVTVDRSIVANNGFQEVKLATIHKLA